MKHYALAAKRPIIQTAVAALSIAMGLSVSACSTSPDKAPPSGANAGATVISAPKDEKAIALMPAEVKQRGTLSVAMDVSSPPNHFMDKDGKTIIGIDADMATMLGQALGLKVTVVGANFDAIIPGLAGKKYDIAIAQMSPTPARETVLDFVDYFQSGTSIAAAKGNPKKITIDTMCGLKVAVLKGSFQESKRVPEYSDKCVAAGKAAIVPSSFPDQQATVLALTSGHVDIVMQDSPVLAYAVKQGAPIEVVGTAHTSAVGIGIPKDSGMLDPIHTAMETLIASKSYKQILDKWGVGGGAVTEAKINDNS